MNPVLTTAVAGLVDTTNRFNAAADRIVRQGVPRSESVFGAPTEAAPKPRPVAGATRSGGGSAVAVNAQGYQPSLAEDILVVKSAVQQYRATASLIRTSSELSDALLDSVGERRKQPRS